jgi:hypothetical protein
MNSHDVFTAEARYVRLLVAVERAHAVGDFDEMARLLSGIDPVDVRMVADVLGAMSELHRVWAGTTGERPDGKSDEGSRQAAPSLALVSEGESPSYPPTGPEYSVKVPPPCS